MNIWRAWGEALEFIYNSTFTRGSFKNLKQILTWFVHQIIFYGEHMSADVVFNLVIDGERKDWATRTLQKEFFHSF